MKVPQNKMLLKQDMSDRTRNFSFLSKFQIWLHCLACYNNKISMSTSAFEPFSIQRTRDSRFLYENFFLAVDYVSTFFTRKKICVPFARQKLEDSTRTPNINNAVTS